MNNTLKLVRQKSALSRLKEQLKSGVKNAIEREVVRNKKGKESVFKTEVKYELSDKDKARIEREILILETKIKGGS